MENDYTLLTAKKVEILKYLKTYGWKLRKIWPTLLQGMISTEPPPTKILKIDKFRNKKCKIIRNHKLVITYTTKPEKRFLKYEKDAYYYVSLDSQKEKRKHLITIYPSFPLLHMRYRRRKKRTM